jgi:hypothetical protein
MWKALAPADAVLTAASWRGFVAMLAGFALAAWLACAALILWADPFGLLRARPGNPAPVLMDSNQRFMYPQLVWSGRFDSAVIGTSSSRLLDPRRLSDSFGHRFANLAMNAATPWEQVQMARLLRRNQPGVEVLVWGIDTTWCEADADTAEKRLTPRPFPEEFYAGRRPGWRSLAGQLNLSTLEIAGRRLLLAAGQGAPRMRADGYDEFTPPDATYDAGRARFHLYFLHHGKPPAGLPPEPAVAQEESGHAFPALRWLEAELAALPPGTRRLILLPPVHWAHLPTDGVPEIARDAACKRALVDLAGRVNAALLDYRLLSPLTRDDARFWDPLHYRVDVARRIEADLHQVALTGRLEGESVVLRAAPAR